MRTTVIGSATQSNLVFSEQARSGFLKSANSLLNFKENKCKTKAQRNYLNQSIVHFTVMYLTADKKINYFKNLSHVKARLKESQLETLELEGCSKLYRKLGKYYNTSLWIFYMFWISSLLYKSINIRLQKLITN